MCLGVLQSFYKNCNKFIFGAILQYKSDLLALANDLDSDGRSSGADLLVPAARLAFIPVIILWIISLAIFLIFEISGNTAGTLGDSFNVLNSLISGLALGAIALSLFLQRSDLKATLAEMQHTTAAMEEQVRHLKFERDRNIREFAATFQSESLKSARLVA